MINNKIISISEDEFNHYKKQARLIIKQLNLDLKNTRIYYKYTISGNNMLIEIKSDFSELLRNRSQQKRNEDYHFIKFLGYDFCFINEDILKIKLEDHSIQNYHEEDLTKFIQGKEYNTAYGYLLNTSDNIDKCVLILTLQK